VEGPADRALRLNEAAFLVMGAFGIKGGLLYTLFPGPRYAYRELLYKKIIQGRSDGNFTVSGERLLRIIGRALGHTGDDARLDAALSAGALPVGAGEAFPASAPPAAGAEAEAEPAAAEAKPSEGNAPPEGKGLSAGTEGILPYDEEFTLE
jgi:hypothetical protein